MSFRRALGPFDATMVVIGGIIGSGIFLNPALVAQRTDSAGSTLSVWALGMFITLLACFAFAEMGAMFPEAGGQYVYMREAYGEFVAFLYGWMIFTVSVGGTIAALGVGFAVYLGSVFPAVAADRPLVVLRHFTFTYGHMVAISAIAAQTAINIFGVRRGAILQNIATWLKFAAIAGFVVLGVAIGKGSWSHLASGSAIPAGANSPSLLAGVGVALIAVFWAYDGWVYITWVSGEVKTPQRNLPRSMVFGLLLVGAIYLLINSVYLYALPIGRISDSTAVAQSAATVMFSSRAANWLALVIALSCFGAMASCILSGARVYYAMAEDGVFFKRLARVNPRWHTPVASLVLQGIWSSALALSGKYNELFTYVMFMMVLSYVLTVVALFVLRRKLPNAERPYRCTGYPWLPALYVALGGIWAINAMWERPKEALAGMIWGYDPVTPNCSWRRQKRTAAERALAAN